MHEAGDDLPVLVAARGEIGRVHLKDPAVTYVSTSITERITEAARAGTSTRLLPPTVRGDVGSLESPEIDRKSFAMEQDQHGSGPLAGRHVGASLTDENAQFGIRGWLRRSSRRDEQPLVAFVQGVAHRPP